MALKEILIWIAVWTTAGYPEPIDSTKNSTHVVAYLQSEVVTCLSLLFIEANAISLLSGRLSSFEGYLELGGKYHSMCTNTFFVWYFLHSPHDPKKVRVIKEYFMGKVMLGFIGSNSNMAFAITDIIVWLFKFTIKYVMYFTKFQTRFFDSVVWNSCGKEHCHENSVWEIFSPTFVSSIKRWWEDSVNMVCITSFSFKVNFMTELILKVYFFQNSDKFPIGSLIETSKVLPVDKLDCFTEYVISIHIWNISIEIFKRAMLSFCRLSTSPSV